MSEEKNQTVPNGMVTVPGGSFMMGSTVDASEQPIHRVTLDSFYMDITQVTQQDYEALMGVNPSHFTGDSKRPVERVTWYDAVLYCNARSKRDELEPVYRYEHVTGEVGDRYGCVGLLCLEVEFSKNGYRLPTEAEWEYACRAGTTTRYYWGDSMDGAYAWWDDNSCRQTHPVGTKEPNAQGLYDMNGNVMEWCHDWYKERYASSPEKNPPGPDSSSDSGGYRVYRGGSWSDCYSNWFRSAYRNNGLPGVHFGNLGFRCVVARY